MQNFYFNECFPGNGSKEIIVQKFADSLREYSALLNKKLSVERSIITEKLPSQINTGNAGSLQNLIEELSSNDLRNLAYSLFIRHPIQRHFELDSKLEEILLEHSYCLTIGNVEYDAINLAITHHNNGLLFTTATHSDLETNTLACKSKFDSSNLPLDSLYGDTQNTTYIEGRIFELELSSKNRWEQLMGILGNCICTKAFEREFKSLTDNEQDSIVVGFQDAKNRNLASPFFPDTKLIKDVTPQHSKKTVLELRIYTPSALRVYFNEDGNNVYVAKLALKSSPNQSADIKLADLTINKLMLTGA